MSIIPNSTQVPNIIIDRYMKQLTGTEFRVLMIIVRKTFGWILNPETGMRKTEDWISRSQLQNFSGAHTQAVSSSIQKLQQLGLIDIRDQSGKQLLTPKDRRGKRLFYRISTNMFENQTSMDRHNMFENQSLKIKHTKETYTKTLSKDNGGFVKKQPSCPLLNGSPLKEKYPNGHTECVEFIQSEEIDRANKFINLPKQYQFIHKILRAGYGFDVMNKTIHLVEKKYGKGSWDFGTLTNWIEKGALNG